MCRPVATALLIAFALTGCYRWTATDGLPRRPHEEEQTIRPDESVLEQFCELNPDVWILRTDHGEEEGHTGSTAADGDHVVIRTNGNELEATPFSNGAPVSDPACSEP